MANILRPDPSGFLREIDAVSVRDAAEWQRKRTPVDIDPPEHRANGEIEKFHPEVPATFTKGLPHDAFGIVKPEAFGRFVKFINQKRSQPNLFRYSDPNGDDVEIGPHGNFNDDKVKKEPRTWESPLAGHVFSLEGADADMVTMPPAPKLGSGELSVEMAEVYALALLRDVPLTDISAGKGKAKDIINGLQGFSWYTAALGDKRADARRRARLDDTGDLTSKVAFRGSTEGAKKGPYLSQFMLIGNASRGDSTPIFTTDEAVHAQNICPIRLPSGKPAKAKDGYIVYGTQLIDQRTTAHSPISKDDNGNPTGVIADYLTDWASWIDAQNGANFKGRDDYAEKKRFIVTPRDLGSYVHFDQLYQAYLNACFILLAYNYPFDEGLPEGNGHPIRDAFATFGGPHILSLVTEVASRALKFARRQKFNIHLRARPEAIAGVLTLAKHGDHAKELGAKALRAATEALKEFENAKAASGVDLLDRIATHNADVNAKKAVNPQDWIEPKKNHLLPMAFPEGSPMHPSYAAGHATVAGACITILKAFFMMFDNIDKKPHKKRTRPNPKTDSHWKKRKFISLYGKTDAAIENTIGLDQGTLTTGIMVPDADGQNLVQQGDAENKHLTVLGELDKLAANISIARDMAGVHYYTDYYESLRMGERMAVSILEEQMLTYPEPVTMRIETFDGDRMVIEGQGDGATVKFRICKPKKGGGWQNTGYKEWFER